jgi:DNA polymerase-3 subunit gamma/tau
VSEEEHSQPQQRSLYRRHRPRTFAEVVGQEAVVRTLRNAVERGRVHHAYLFVGSRGTGKTSMAKILAACLNCESGPTTEPCGRCESCLSIARATSLDVIEMDAASNNSVDDIRELRESVAYAPVSGRRKVYILDEAHMLSTAAWNAFLKTLEEPPPNTVFVLATTEAGKVPATVIDRCHRFDFQRPTVEQIATVVRRAAEADSIEIPPAAVAALARAATGSFRDALGTLEQILTYSASPIVLEDVLAVLGQADATLLAAAVDAVAAGDSAEALRTLERCVEQGRDAASFAADLEVRLRELLVVQAIGEVPGELSLTPEVDAELRAQADRVDHAIVVRLLELLAEAMEAVRAGADPRTRLELALVKAARPEVDGSMRALLARIERLERGGGEGSQPGRHAGRAPGEDTAAARSTAGETHADDGDAESAAAVRATAREAHADDGEAETAAQRTGAGSVAPAAAAAAAARPPAVPDPAPIAAAAAASEVEDAEDVPLQTRGLEGVAALWPAVVDLVREENALLGALIAEARPVAARGEDLTLAFSASAQFLKKKAEDPGNRMTVGEALHAVTGARWRLSYELREQPGEEAGDGSERGEEDWVRRFIEEFDAEEIGGDWVSLSTSDGEDERGRTLSGNEKGS